MPLSPLQLLDTDSLIADDDRAIRDTVGGKMFLSPRVSSLVIDGYLSGAKAPADPLAPREREEPCETEVARLLAGDGELRARPIEPGDAVPPLRQEDGVVPRPAPEVEDVSIRRHRQRLREQALRS